MTVTSLLVDHSFKNLFIAKVFSPKKLLITWSDFLFEKHFKLLTQHKTIFWQGIYPKNNIYGYLINSLIICQTTNVFFWQINKNVIRPNIFSRQVFPTFFLGLPAPVTLSRSFHVNFLKTCQEPLLQTTKVSFNP